MTRPKNTGGSLTAVSLWAGIDGFDLDCRRAGITVTTAVKIAPVVRHFPGTTLFEDVTEVTGDQLRSSRLSFTDEA